MKVNGQEFETSLGVAECGQLFRQAVDRRPLKLKGVPFRYFTPTAAEDPFAAVNGSREPDFSVGATFRLAELYGSVIMSCLRDGGVTRVLLTSAGNMRGRLLTNSLARHVAVTFAEADQRAAPVATPPAPAVTGSVRASPSLPANAPALMERFGRFEMAGRSPILTRTEDSNTIWTETQQPFAMFAVEDPSGFVDELARAVLPVGGWAVYGAALTVWNLIPPPFPTTPAYKALADAALAFLRSHGVPPLRVTGHEWNHWLDGGGTLATWLPQKPIPERGTVRVTELSPGETRIVAQLERAPDSNLVMVRREPDGRHVAIVDAKWSDEDPRRVQNDWKTAPTLHDLYIEIGLSLQVPSYRFDPELEPFFALPRPTI